ncbi:MAG: MBL fold metallo-hydrolase, partial [Phenylobacterium sp.]
MRKIILTLGLAAGLSAPAAAAPDFANRQDFVFADRGFLGSLAQPRLTTGDGRLVFDLSAYEFLKGPAPASVNPSLWRHSQLLAKH